MVHRFAELLSLCSIASRYKLLSHIGGTSLGVKVSMVLLHSVSGFHKIAAKCVSHFGDCFFCKFHFDNILIGLSFLSTLFTVYGKQRVGIADKGELKLIV